LFTIHKFLLGTIQHHHNHPEQLRLNVHQFLPRIIHHHGKASGTTKAQMFTIFFLGPDFIITNIRNNNVTHDEPVSSQEQPSSLQTTGTTKA
jgi:hypothetical protein